MTLARLSEALADVLARTGPWAPAVLFLASFVEYVFPPAPGDLLVVLGAWYAVRGELSWASTFAWTTAGAVAGAWVDHRIGASLGRRVDRALARRRLVDEAALARFEAGYRRWGAWLLVLNRFLPGVRAFFFVAAGASGIPLRKVLLYGGVSACAWNALLLAVGAVAARNAGDLVLFLDRYTRAAWIALAAAGAIAAAALVLRRRRAARPERP